MKKERHSQNQLCLGNHYDLQPQAVVHTLCHAGSHGPGLTVGNLGSEDSGQLQCRERAREWEKPSNHPSHPNSSSWAWELTCWLFQSRAWSSFSSGVLDTTVHVVETNNTGSHTEQTQGCLPQWKPCSKFQCHSLPSSTAVICAERKSP